LIATGIDGYALMFCCRVVAGLGVGSAFAVSAACLGEQKHPERAFGLALAIQTAFMIPLFVVLPAIVESWGIDGLFFILLFLSLLVALVVSWLPKRSGKRQQITTPDSKMGPRGIALIATALVATFIHFVGAVGFWAYLERIGDAAGHPTSFIGIVLALALTGGLAGGLVAAWLSHRFGFIWPFVVTTVLLVVSLIILVDDVSGPMLIIGAVIFDGMWVIANAYQAALVAKLDTWGRYIVLLPAAQGGGSMFGPALAAMLIPDNSYLGVNIMAGICFAVSLVLFVVVSPRRN